DFIVAWGNKDPTGNFEVYATEYNSDADVIGELQVNDTSEGPIEGPSVAMDASGDAIVTWSNASADLNGTYGIYARRFAQGLVLQAGFFTVNTTQTGSQNFPQAAMSAAGKTVLTWRSNQNGSDYDIYAQRYTGFIPIDLSASLSLAPGAVVSPGS